MFYHIRKYQHGLITRSLTFLITTSFCLGLIAPQAIYAQQVLNLPVPGTMVMPSHAYNPVVMLGMTLHPENPLHIDFIIDRGDDRLEDEALREESQKLLAYFYATMTVPEEDMWVNLSPYESDRIIADGLGQTVLGRDMLAQDYLLKQLSASMAYPEEEMGKEFWKRVRSKVQSEYGQAEIPMNTFNKIWIMPDTAKIYRHQNSVFVIDNYLKVMLEEDYVALEHNSGSQSSRDPLTGITNEIVREVLIPEIEYEINYGKNFAPLRQMFHSMVLATWYKQNLKSSMLTQMIANQNKTDGINAEDSTAIQKIYDQYVEAFKVGVYDYIREEMDTATNELIPRKYFSGGVDSAQLTVDEAPISISQAQEFARRDLAQLTSEVRMSGVNSNDQAMTISRDLDPYPERSLVEVNVLLAAAQSRLELYERRLVVPDESTTETDDQLRELIQFFKALVNRYSQIIAIKNFLYQMYERQESVLFETSDEVNPAEEDPDFYKNMSIEQLKNILKEKIDVLNRNQEVLRNLIQRYPGPMEQQDLKMKLAQIVASQRRVTSTIEGVIESREFAVDSSMTEKDLQDVRRDPMADETLEAAQSGQISTQVVNMYITRLTPLADEDSLARERMIAYEQIINLQSPEGQTSAEVERAIETTNAVGPDLAVVLERFDLTIGEGSGVGSMEGRNDRFVELNTRNLLNQLNEEKDFDTLKALYLIALEARAQDYQELVKRFPQLFKSNGDMIEEVVRVMRSMIQLDAQGNVVIKDSLNPPDQNGETLTTPPSDFSRTTSVRGRRIEVPGLGNVLAELVTKEQNDAAMNSDGQAVVAEWLTEDVAEIIYGRLSQSARDFISTNFPIELRKDLLRDFILEATEYISVYSFEMTEQGQVMYQNFLRAEYESDVDSAKDIDELRSSVDEQFVIYREIVEVVAIFQEESSLNKNVTQEMSDYDWITDEYAEDIFSRLSQEVRDFVVLTAQDGNISVKAYLKIAAQNADLYIQDQDLSKNLWQSQMLTPEGQEVYRRMVAAGKTNVFNTFFMFQEVRRIVQTFLYELAADRLNVRGRADILPTDINNPILRIEVRRIIEGLPEQEDLGDIEDFSGKLFDSDLEAESDIDFTDYFEHVVDLMSSGSSLPDALRIFLQERGVEEAILLPDVEVRNVFGEDRMIELGGASFDAAMKASDEMRALAKRIIEKNEFQESLRRISGYLILLERFKNMQQGSQTNFESVKRSIQTVYEAMKEQLIELQEGFESASSDEEKIVWATIRHYMSANTTALVLLAFVTKDTEQNDFDQKVQQAKSAMEEARSFLEKMENLSEFELGVEERFQYLIQPQYLFTDAAMNMVSASMTDVEDPVDRIIIMWNLDPMDVADVIEEEVGWIAQSTTVFVDETQERMELMEAIKQRQTPLITEDVIFTFENEINIVFKIDAQSKAFNITVTHPRGYEIETALMLALVEALENTDAAMSEAQVRQGGIDFNAKNLNLTEEGDDPIQFDFPDLGMDPAQINGITPVILNIAPITNLPLLLGLINREDEFEEVTSL